MSLWPSQNTNITQHLGSTYHHSQGGLGLTLRNERLNSFRNELNQNGTSRLSGSGEGVRLHWLKNRKDERWKMTGIVRCSVSSDHGWKEAGFQDPWGSLQKTWASRVHQNKSLKNNSCVMRGASARKCKLFVLVPLQFKKRYSKLDWLSSGAAHPSMSPR